MQLPKANEVWKHYNGGTYLIIGLGYDEDGQPVVIYCDNTEPPCEPYYTRSVGSFLQTVDVDMECHLTGRALNEGHIPNGVATKVARFKITHERRIAPSPARWPLDAGVPNGGM